MSLKFIKTGVLDGIHDRGRQGFRHLGINPGGVMDPASMEIANMLVGNHAGEPVLEMHFPGPQLEFTKFALVALAGADFQAECNEERIRTGRPFIVGPGCRLRFRKHIRGMRCYLAVKGGFNVRRWLGSASPHMASRERPGKGTEIAFNEEKQHVLTGKKPVCIPLKWYIPHPVFPVAKIIFLPGVHWDRLGDESRSALPDMRFQLENHSDRMAHYFSHDRLIAKNQNEILSEAVDRGVMQLLPTGRILVLAADHQTTGGYPVIGHVIRGHIPALSQLRPGELISFVSADSSVAAHINYQYDQKLRQLREACRLQLEKTGL